MITMVLIEKRGEGYYSTVCGSDGSVHQGARAGLTPYDAAVSATKLMLAHAPINPQGGELMAPAEVLELVPVHLRSVAGES